MPAQASTPPWPQHWTGPQVTPLSLRASYSPVPGPRYKLAVQGQEGQGVWTGHSVVLLLLLLGALPRLVVGVCCKVVVAAAGADPFTRLVHLVLLV